MDVAWTVPPDEEGEGRGRNVPRWQLTAGGVGELWRRVEEATELHSMDSLSLSTSGEDFAPLWRALKDSLWTEATGAKNTWSTCSTTVSCFANTVQGSLIFFTISYKEHG